MRISRFPSDRGWNLEGLFDPDPDHPGTTYTREGGFLRDVGHFDAEFFGISPRESLAMDPQQRLLLECSWEAIEYGEIDPASMSGSDTGVFVGVTYHDYGMRLAGAVPQDMEAYLGLGSAGSVASGRVAYSFGFQGPAVTVDTACSSSLVALHWACGALRRGECSMALAGGVTVLSTPGVFVEFARQRGLAGDGRCKSYASAANGTGWSEGIGMLALERLSEAQDRGHHILAVIRGSAINQDGASNGLTAPNGPSQQRVIRQALANAGLTSAAIDVVEGHGTGTTLGDPIEAQALLATYGRERPDRAPLWLGSVKSNIGHTQAAAGVAGVIKMVMAMRAGVLPRTLHVDEPSRQVDWSSGAVALLTQEQQWDCGEEPRRAGVSSFGVSGTNAHMILEQAPADLRNGKPVGEGGNSSGLFVDLPLVPWVISGHGPHALHAQAAQLLAHVAGEPDLDIGDVGRALARRSRFNHRAVVLGADRKGLLEGLSALAQGDSVANLTSGVGSGDRQVVFLFPGQGSQWVGMALELLDESPVFAEHMRACADALAPFTDWSLLDVLRGSEQAPGLDRVDVVQPVLFAVMVSLAELWRACGVRPAAVVGHSQGEVAAAYIAGGLTLQDAACVVALRSRALQEVAWQGGTVSVSLPAGEVVPLLGRWGDLLCVAAVNGPRSVAVSGDPEALVELLASCEAQDIRARKIEMNFAAHSSQMDPLREGLLEGLAEIAPRSCEIPFHSTVTGEPLDAAQLDAGYWYRNLREPVQLESVIRRLLTEGHRSFVEVSPHPVLISGVQETIDDFDASPGSVAVTGSLRRSEGDAGRFLCSLASVFVHGTDLDWERVIGEGDVPSNPLPTYAFQRSRYWLEAPSGVVGGTRASGARPADHPLLSAALTVAADRKWLFTGRLSLQTHPWLADHVAMGVVLLPGSALLELALHAGAQLDCAEVHELTLQAPLMIPEEGGTLIQISVGEPDELGARSVSIHSRAMRLEEGEPDLGEEAWIGNAEGVLVSTGSGEPGGSSSGARPDTELPVQMWPPKGAVEVDIEDLYAHLSEHGLDYGPAFQGLQAVWRRGDELFAEVALPDVQREQASRFGLHPALLDAALHAIGVTEFGEERGLADAQVHGGTMLPFSWSGVRLNRAGAVSLRVQLVPVGPDAMSLAFFDEYGEEVASVRSLTLRPVSAQQLDQAGADEQRLLLGVNWTPPMSIEVPSVESIVLLGADSRLALVAKSLDLDIHSDLGSLTEAIAQGLDAPDVVIVDWALRGREAQLPDPIDSGLSDAAHSAVKHALGLAQEWIANECYADTRLVLVTHGAMCADAGEESPDPVGASVWGLIGSAISEHPGRFCLVDLDGEPESSALLRTVLASGEPKLAVRKGKLLVPRLVRVGAGQDSRDRNSRLAPDGTVLITGGTGKLGGFVAKHLVAHHGVPSVVLVSRAGRQAEGAAALERELLELGAKVAVEACDVTDRAQLAGLIDGIPHDLPLRAVVHAAGVLDDGVIESLTPDSVDRVLGPKVDAAWHLHELTRDLDLSAFVMFSSFSGVLGSPGQGNYAAANVFMDALATARRAQGLAAVSIAWGLWGEAGGLTGELGEADLNRLAKSGMRAMSEHEGMLLFDAVLESEQTEPVALCLDAAALRAQAKVQALAPLLHGLVPVPPVRVVEGRGRQFVQRLKSLPSAERETAVRETVFVEVAAVLGHTSSGAIDPQRPFKELGFDSLMAVELRNRLSAKTGLRLPATLVFDYPNPASLAGRLLEEVDGASVEFAITRSARIGSDEPIAIVGMACRYPGGVSSPEELWALVESGGDAISGFPNDRGWDLRALYDPDPDRLGTAYTREGGFLRDALEFDAGFFDISPREALAMDPQQRLLLESSWEALEHAGIDPLSLHGSQTGVFGGVMYSDYGARLLGSAPSDLEGYIGIGSAGSVVSGRVAYALGLEGPALTVDTACSSSLVAMHLACASLRDGECSLALAGGVTVLSNPHVFVAFSRQRGLAPDGRCKSFAEEADGTGWAEGVGILVLERLSQAQHRGHRVLALVRGSAVNQDGASNGLTAPNGPSQQRVIRQALANAGMRPADVDAVEGHGTGTRLGDPIEAQALQAVYGEGDASQRTLWLGSIKSNMGHTQAAAGVAGVIKMTMAMRHGMLPRTLHVKEPSKHVDWSTGPVSLLREERLWERNGKPRRAAVSSFGISGTNAHLILEEAPVEASLLQSTSATVLNAPEDKLEMARPLALDALPWVLSAKNEHALRDQARRLLAYVERYPDIDAVDVGLALAGRAQLEQRAVLVGADRDELLVGLSRLANGQDSPTLVSGRVGGVGRLALLFTGQGAQRVGMGAELSRQFPVFRSAFEEACGHFDQHLGCSLAQLVLGDASPRDGGPENLSAREGASQEQERSGPSEREHGLLDDTTFAQAGLFSFELALFRLVEAWGIKPDYLLGHSVGELVAACVAGVLSLDDACRLVAARGRLMGRLPTGGAMLAIQVSEQEARKSLEPYEGQVALAAVNSPSSIVLSGEESAVLDLQRLWEKRGRKVKMLRVSHAFHSHLIDAMLEEYREVAESVSLSAPTIPVFSNLTGTVLGAEQACSADYWVRHARETVRFADEVEGLYELGTRSFLELGPDGTLSSMVGECVAQGTAIDRDEQLPVAVSLLRERRSEVSTTFAGLAQAWTRGGQLDWTAVFQGLGARSVELPTYAFQRERYWLERETGATDLASLGQARQSTPCLERRSSWLPIVAGSSQDASPWTHIRGLPTMS